MWGEEGDGGVAGYDKYDCSGFDIAMYRDVGHPLPGRPTAEILWHMGTHIAAPSLVGDTFYLFDPNGHAHHTGLYIGKGQIVEARSPQLDVCLGTVASANSRGARWNRRFADLGNLTPPAVVKTPVGTRYVVVPAVTYIFASRSSTSAKKMKLIHGNVVTQRAGDWSGGYIPCSRWTLATGTVTGYAYMKYLVREK